MISCQGVPSRASSAGTTRVCIARWKTWNWWVCSMRTLHEQKESRKNLRLAVDRGLSEADALAALTTVPARVCGVDEKLGSIAPGIYKVFVFDSYTWIDYGNPEILARYASRATTIRVGANDETTFAVDVIHVGD